MNLSSSGGSNYEKVHSSLFESTVSTRLGEWLKDAMVMQVILDKIRREVADPNK